MHVNPHYKANAELKQYLTHTDRFISIERVDKLFDKEWCDNVANTLANGKPVRRLFVTGTDIGNHKEPTLKFYLQIF